jgi:hypothetical protein
VLGLDFLDHLPLVGGGENIIVEGGEVPGPRVKDLDDLGTAVDLEAGVFACFWGEEGRDGGRDGGTEGWVSGWARSQRPGSLAPRCRFGSRRIRLFFGGEEGGREGGREGRRDG